MSIGTTVFPEKRIQAPDTFKAFAGKRNFLWSHYQCHCLQIGSVEVSRYSLSWTLAVNFAAIHLHVAAEIIRRPNPRNSSTTVPHRQQYLIAAKADTLHHYVMSETNPQDQNGLTISYLVWSPFFPTQVWPVPALILTDILLRL